MHDRKYVFFFSFKFDLNIVIILLKDILFNLLIKSLFKELQFFFFIKLF
jgi:hypothetical protein